MIYIIDIAEQRRHLNNQDHSMVSFLGQFYLSVRNFGMCCSLSTFLLFLIMTYDETTFRQDERRKGTQRRLPQQTKRYTKDSTLKKEAFTIVIMN